jgi:hypothetical protein
LPSLPATDGPVTAMATGVLTNNGSEAIVVLHASTNTLSVLMANGKGGYAAPVEYATGKDPTSIAVGDVNGDGFADLVVVNSGDDSLSAYFNKGDGTFAASPPASQARLRVLSRLHPQQTEPPGNGLTIPGIPLLISQAGPPNLALTRRRITLAAGDTVVTIPYAGSSTFGTPVVTDFSGALNSITGVAPDPFGDGLDVLGGSASGTGPLFGQAPFGPNGALPPVQSLTWSSLPPGTQLDTAAGTDALASFVPPPGSLQAPFSAFLDTEGGATYVILETALPGPGGVFAGVHWSEYPLPPSCAGNTTLRIRISTNSTAPPDILLVDPANVSSPCILRGDGKGGFMWVQTVPGAEVALKTHATFSRHLSPYDSSSSGGVDTADNDYLWLDSAGTLHAAPFTIYAGGPTIVTSIGSTSDQVGGTLQSGAPSISGIDLAGPQFTNFAASPSISGLPGASVTPITGGIHIGLSQPLPSTFSFTLTNLQPFVASDAQVRGNEQMFGTDASGAETVWFNVSTQY